MRKIRFLGIGSIMVLCICGWNSNTYAQTRIGSMVHIMNAQSTKLIGYGLVTGLSRTGDRTFGQRGAAFTVQSITNMLQKFGINVDSRYLHTRNVAAVMVTSEVSAYDVPEARLM